MRVRDFDFDNIFSYKKSYDHSYQNIWIYNISYKNFMGANPLHIRFNKKDGFIKVYDVTRY